MTAVAVKSVLAINTERDVDVDVTAEAECQ